MRIIPIGQFCYFLMLLVMYCVQVLLSYLRLHFLSCTQWTTLTTILQYLKLNYILILSTILEIQTYNFMSAS